MITNRLEALTKKPTTSATPTETKMFAKVFWGYQDKVLESVLQQWLDENPGIMLHSVNQSENGGSMVVTIIYSK